MVFGGRKANLGPFLKRKEGCAAMSSVIREASAEDRKERSREVEEALAEAAEEEPRGVGLFLTFGIEVATINDGFEGMFRFNEFRERLGGAENGGELRF